MQGRSARRIGVERTVAAPAVSEGFWLHMAPRNVHSRQCELGAHVPRAREILLMEGEDDGRAEPTVRSGPGSGRAPAGGGCSSTRSPSAAAPPALRNIGTANSAYSSNNTSVRGTFLVLARAQSPLADVLLSSSYARSASHSSAMSAVSLRLLPVSSSTRRIRYTTVCL
jgi:hypothetical protein